MTLSEDFELIKLALEKAFSDQWIGKDESRQKFSSLVREMFSEQNDSCFRIIINRDDYFVNSSSMVRLTKGKGFPIHTFTATLMLDLADENSVAFLALVADDRKAEFSYLDNELTFSGDYFKSVAGDQLDSVGLQLLSEINSEIAAAIDENAETDLPTNQGELNS
jgi:hypothetical protein